MNIKITKQLQLMLIASPQLMRDAELLKQAIKGTFGVDILGLKYPGVNINITDLAAVVNEAVLEQYFSKVWQPQTKKYKYSGLSIIDEVNALKPKNVLDLGCGYNEFKGKIDNLVGVDPYNDKADIKSTILDFPGLGGAIRGSVFDVTICLGSINFGSVDKVYAELEHAVKLTKTNGLLYFRVNPGEQHTAPEAKWIEFFEWSNEFIINSLGPLNCSLLELRQEYADRGSRYYFVLRVDK